MTTPIATMLISLPAVDERSGLRGSIDVVLSVQCATCQHWTEGLSCRAFPDGIPEPIVTGQHDHTLPYAGDHGLRYLPLPT